MLYLRTKIKAVAAFCACFPMWVALNAQMMPQSWSKIEKIVYEIPSDSIQNLQDLVFYCHQNTHNDTEKALFYYVWLSHNIRYDTASFASVVRGAGLNTDVLDVLASKKAICSGYALTFQALCRQSGLPCRYVSGWGQENDNTLHAWNLVAIDSIWQVMDITWAANKKQLGDGSWRQYFAMPPAIFNLEHLPLDPVLHLQPPFDVENRGDTEGVAILWQEVHLSDLTQRYNSAKRAYKANESLTINQLYWNWARLDSAIAALEVPMALYDSFRLQFSPNKALTKMEAQAWAFRLQDHAVSLQDHFEVLRNLHTRPLSAPMPPVFWEKWAAAVANMQHFQYLYRQLQLFLEN